MNGISLLSIIIIVIGCAIVTISIVSITTVTVLTANKPDTLFDNCGGEGSTSFQSLTSPFRARTYTAIEHAIPSLFTYTISDYRYFIAMIRDDMFISNAPNAGFAKISDNIKISDSSNIQWTNDGVVNSIHKVYRKSGDFLENNWAIIETVDGINLVKNKVQPACIPDEDIFNTEYIVPTFGTERKGNKLLHSNYMNFKRVRLLNGTECNADIHATYCLDESQTFCDFDFGAPVYAFAHNRWYVVGLISYTLAPWCKSKTVIVRLPYFYSEIKKELSP
ncbi:hypothetical protein SNEBB_002788 [Seison nebaliae]|nr:hypothetical protein SNEBB_002788 [Seison nebaliae]